MRKTLWGFTGKLFAIIFVLMVFVGLRWLEDRKGAFDQERKKPVMVVAASPQPSPADEDKSGFNALRADDLRRALKEDGWPLGAAPSPAEAERRREEEVERFVNAVSYQPFKDDDALVARLGEEVIAENERRKKAARDRQDAFSRSRAAKLTALREEADIVSGLLTRRLYAAEGVKEKKNGTAAAQPVEGQAGAEEAKQRRVEEEFKKLTGRHPADERFIARLKSKGKEGSAADATSQAFLAENNATLATWINTVEKQIDDLGREISLHPFWQKQEAEIRAADEAAQGQLRVVYKELPGSLKRKPFVADEAEGWRVFGLFDVKSVFNDQSGAYIVYQTLRTIGVVVLAFFVIALFLMILRPLPLFAAGTATLSQQFESVFGERGGGGGGGGGGEGGAPQAVRLAAMAVAALGVGTAVVVAGGTVSERRPPGHGDAEVAAWYYGGGGGPDINVRWPNWKKPEPPGEQKVVFDPQIVFPEPIRVEADPVPPPDYTPLNNAAASLGSAATSSREMAQSVGTLAERVDTLIAGNRDLKEELDRKAREAAATAVDNLKAGEIKTLQDRTQALQRETDALNLDSAYSAWNTFEMQNRLSGMEDSFGSALGEVTDGISRQNSGGRGLFTRFTQSFRGDRHMVTAQSLDALRRMMQCEGAPGADCVSPESLKEMAEKGETARHAEAQAKNAILKALATMAGQAPRDEKEFLNILKASRAAAFRPAFDRWTPVVLRHTRVSY